MDWTKTVTPFRLKSAESQTRSEFERDQDRIIFSNAFKKLNDKTQVFPIPKNYFVHSRMTHSMEASSVGRSMGQLAAATITNLQPNLLLQHPNFIKDIGEIVKTAALAHDIGNPPFGHSGEDAISHFYRENSNLLSELSEKEKADLTNFEGNAQGFRLLSNLDNGLQLSANTLAVYTKYPRESIVNNYKKSDYQSRVDQKKYGAFQSEIKILDKIMNHFQLSKLSIESSAYSRHPLSYFVEAADDFCYLIPDLEDSIRLKILDLKDIEDYLFNIINHENINIDNCYLNKLANTGEKVGYLRAKAIQSLIIQTTKYFLTNISDITSGNFNNSLTTGIPSAKILNEIRELSINRIYNYKPVLEIEAAGFEVLGGLLETIIDSYLEKHNLKRQKIQELLPPKLILKEDSLYMKLMKINDFISGMTDNYAISLYRKVKGISLPEIY